MLMIHFSFHAVRSTQTAACGSVAAYRAHAGVYHKVFAGVDFALCLQSVLFGLNWNIFATGLVTLRALLRPHHCCCCLSFQCWGHRDARDGTLGQFGASRCDWWRRIQNLHGVGFDQPAGSGGVVAVSEGKDVVGPGKFVNEVVEVATPVQVGARRRPFGGGLPDSFVVVAESPLWGGGLGRALQDANTTTSSQ